METFTINLSLRNTKAYKLKDGTFPVKYNVYDKRTLKRRYYKTGIYTTEQYHKWVLTKPTGKLSMDYRKAESHIEELRKLYAEKLAHAKEIAKKLKPFTVEAFKEALDNDATPSALTVNEYFQQAIDERRELKKIGTLTSYEQALKRFQTFKKYQKSFHKKSHSTVTELTFEEITPKFLNQFETWYIYESSKKIKSASTVGIYMRSLKAIFNMAIDAKTISPELYPFFKKGNTKGYKIPTVNRTNKGIRENEISVLFNSIPQNEQQQIAKDFWFFSLLSNGMNLKDIALLRFRNIDYEDKKFEFVRSKTASTRKDAQSKIVVILQEYHLEIFTKYGTKKVNDSDFVFDIVRRTDSPEQQHQKIGNFVRKINNALKTLAKNNGINENISFQWARHTYTQIHMKNGTNMIRIGQNLGHTDIKTTIAYAGTLDREEHKHMSDLIYNTIKGK